LVVSHYFRPYCLSSRSATLTPLSWYMKFGLGLWNYSIIRNFIEFTFSFVMKYMLAIL
jgi:hypothetical protein